MTAHDATVTVHRGAAGEGPFASPVDIARFGEYRITQTPDDPRPLYRFEGRISNDGSTPYAAEAGRYHIYSGWFCPWAQRVTIAHALAGLDDVISVSYVDGARDARGWAFRATYGPDPVNGFTLLRDAYEVTEPGFDGHVSVPTLWDRVTGRVVSNQFRTIGIDLATQFGALATPLIDTYPADLADDIEQLDAWIGPNVNRGVNAVAGNTPSALLARDLLLDTFRELDKRLSTSRFLLGDRLTEADIRLFVTLVRYDQTVNADRTINAGLAEYSEPVGVRPRPVRDPRVPRHHRLHVVQRAGLVDAAGEPRRPADGGRLMTARQSGTAPRRRPRRHRVPPGQLARSVGATDRDVHRQVLDVARARPPSAACSTSSPSRTRSGCSRRSSAGPTAAPIRSAAGSTRC